MDVILPVLIDAGVPDENVVGMLRTRIGMDKLREVAAVNWKPLPGTTAGWRRWRPPTPTCGSSPRTC